MKKILIVDDEPHMLRVLQFTLAAAGYEVCTESDGKAGYDHVLAAPPDVLISDIRMPRMDGRKMMQAIHQAMPQRRFLVLVMSSLTAREERDWVRELGNVEFLEKPVSPRQLVVRLARHFESLAIAEASQGA